MNIENPNGYLLYVPRKNPWNDSELIKELVRLDAEGLSFSKIAAELGHGLTRNACIGKARRLGLPKRGPEQKANNAAHPRKRNKTERPPSSVKRQPQMRRTPFNDFRMVDMGVELEPVRNLLPDSIPIKQRRTFAQLREHHCRFPYGDVGQPDFFFCGGEKYRGSYCEFHHRIAHNRPSRQVWEQERDRNRERKIMALKIAAEAQRISG